MNIFSPVFRQNEMIPPEYTCTGKDVNPALEVTGVPAEAQSLALVVDDPDAPAHTWVHWIVFNIDPATQKIDENSIPGTQGRNDFDKLNYGGPCPPSGKHRYFFKAYALDATLGLDEGAAIEDLEKAIKGHVLEKAELVGLYQKERGGITSWQLAVSAYW